MNTHSRINKFRIPFGDAGQIEFEIHQGNYGNQRETYFTATRIGPRGGRMRLNLPEIYLVNEDYPEVRAELIEKILKLYGPK